MVPIGHLTRGRRGQGSEQLHLHGALQVLAARPVVALVKVPGGRVGNEGAHTREHVLVERLYVRRPRRWRGLHCDAAPARRTPGRPDAPRRREAPILRDWFATCLLSEGDVRLP